MEKEPGRARLHRRDNYRCRTADRDAGRDNDRDAEQPGLPDHTGGGKNTTGAPEHNSAGNGRTRNPGGQELDERKRSRCHSEREQGKKSDELPPHSLHQHGLQPAAGPPAKVERTERSEECKLHKRRER